MKKTLLWALLCVFLLTGCGQTTAPPEKSDKLHVVAAIFPAYDFARAAAGDLAEVELLLPPGAESHSYEPTPADILAVQNCDLFLYLGGEGDTWLKTILDAVELKGESMTMMDQVDLLEEMSVEGMQEEPGHHHSHGHENDHDHEHDHDHENDHDHEHGQGEVVEMDEHVWTDPQNAAKITRAVGEKLGQLDPANAAGYAANAESYAQKLEDLDQEFTDFFAGLPDKTIIFGDRFPLRYFAEAYDLDYYAAFPGCSKQTEPSAATIAFLTEKVKEEQMSTIYYIEFSNHLVADSIAEATGKTTAMFHTCHNISPQELEAGETYLSLMKRNLDTLRATLPDRKSS